MLSKHLLKMKRAVYKNGHGLNAPFLKARFILLPARAYFAEHPVDKN